MLWPCQLVDARFLSAVGMLLVNGASAVYCDEAFAGNESKLLMQSLLSPASINALFFPVLSSVGSDDVRESLAALSMQRSASLLPLIRFPWLPALLIVLLLEGMHLAIIVGFSRLRPDLYQIFVCCALSWSLLFLGSPRVASGLQL